MAGTGSRTHASSPYSSFLPALPLLRRLNDACRTAMALSDAARSVREVVGRLSMLVTSMGRAEAVVGVWKLLEMALLRLLALLCDAELRMRVENQSPWSFLVAVVSKSTPPVTSILASVL